jgi:hypothetical protein
MDIYTGAPSWPPIPFPPSFVNHAFFSVGPDPPPNDPPIRYRIAGALVCRQRIVTCSAAMKLAVRSLSDPYSFANRYLFVASSISMPQCFVYSTLVIYDRPIVDSITNTHRSLTDLISIRHRVVTDSLTHTLLFAACSPSARCIMTTRSRADPALLLNGTGDPGPSRDAREKPSGKKKAGAKPANMQLAAGGKNAALTRAVPFAPVEDKVCGPPYDRCSPTNR